MTFLELPCPGCGVPSWIPVGNVTVTPSYVGWRCLFYCRGQVWRVAAEAGLRAALVTAGATWTMEDPLTAGDIEDLVNELVWAGDTYGDRLVAALETETRT